LDTIYIFFGKYDSALDIVGLELNPFVLTTEHNKVAQVLFEKYGTEMMYLASFRKG